MTGNYYELMRKVGNLTLPPPNSGNAGPPDAGVSPLSSLSQEVQPASIFKLLSQVTVGSSPGLQIPGPESHSLEYSVTSGGCGIRQHRGSSVALRRSNWRGSCDRHTPLSPSSPLEASFVGSGALARGEDGTRGTFLSDRFLFVFRLLCVCQRWGTGSQPAPLSFRKFSMCSTPCFSSEPADACCLLISLRSPPLRLRESPTDTNYPLRCSFQSPF